MENRQSTEIADLVKAMVKFQADIKNPKKESVNPFFHSNYADLNAVWDSCRELLSKNGLVVIQTAVDLPTGSGLTTTLLHTSGQWISGTLPLMPVKNDPQAQGSAITYARRYCLSAILGIVADEDDDAEAATRHDKEAGKGTTPPPSKMSCPKCGKPAIIKGRAEYGGGYVCYAKIGGCGAKFESTELGIEEKK